MNFSDPKAAFVIAAYIVAFLIIASMIVATIVDYRELKKVLARLIERTGQGIEDRDA